MAQKLVSDEAFAELKALEKSVRINASKKFNSLRAQLVDDLEKRLSELLAEYDLFLLQYPYGDVLEHVADRRYFGHVEETFVETYQETPEALRQYLSSRCRAYADMLINDELSSALSFNTGEWDGDPVGSIEEQCFVPRCAVDHFDFINGILSPFTTEG